MLKCDFNKDCFWKEQHKKKQIKKRVRYRQKNAEFVFQETSSKFQKYFLKLFPTFKVKLFKTFFE